MAKNDEGEFELVLGNKQLLSVFFIVVVLLGVFFTMGYIVGRNTGAEVAAQMAATPGQPLVVESETASAAGTAPRAAPVRTTPPPPVRTTPAPPPQAAPPPVARPPVRPKRTVRTPPPPPPAPATTGGQPAPGQTFLQVAATTQPEAEVLRDLLAKRGFRSRIAPVPGQNLYRVLVGPVNSAEAISENRTKLQAAGFKPFTRRYR